MFYIKIANTRRKRIHVNRQILARNLKHLMNNPAVGVEVSGEPKYYAHKVEILGPSDVIHQQEKPLKCGARCWIETKAPVVLHTSNSLDFAGPYQTNR